MRELKSPVGLCVAVWAAFATIFQLYTAYIGFLEPREQRSLHIMFFLSLAFLLFPARPGRSPMQRPSAVDFGLALIAIVGALYSYVEAFRISMRFEGVDPVAPTEMVLGILMTGLMVEALRRAVTPVLAGLASVILFYMFTTEYWPGIFAYRDIPLWEIVEVMYLRNGMGIFGTLAGISTTMVAIFIAFGAFVQGLGLGTLFNNIGSRVAGRQVGGPGKVAVITSAFFGTMSGSASANVFATGSFTIPMMKRLGYRPTFSGGVETAASVGGQLMPPIMGAGAFVMAEVTNIPYVEILKAAALGAVLYFFMLLITVHFEAKRHGLKGMEEKDLPLWRDVVRDLHLLLPVVVLLVLLLFRYSPHFCAFWSIVASVVVACLRKHTRPSLKGLFWILVEAGKNTTLVAVACVGAGMIVAGLTVTGLVVALGTIVAGLSGGVLLIAGAMLMFATLLLGMGLPTTAAYVITSAIGAPVLTSEFGVSMLAAHLFVFYFSILADATPPVSIASYAAASIAKAPPIQTGLQAYRMAIAGFIVGFSFLYTPALLLQGTVTEIVGQFLINIIGLTLLAAGMAGFFRRTISLPVRALLILAGPTLALLEAFPVWSRVPLGLGLCAALYLMAPILQPRRRGVAQPEPAALGSTTSGS